MIKKDDRLHHFRCILSLALTRDKTFTNIMFSAYKLDTNYGFPELFLNSDKEILTVIPVSQTSKQKDIIRQFLLINILERYKCN